MAKKRIEASKEKGGKVPADRVELALEIIKENGRYAGIIRETPTGPFINLDSPGVPAPTATPEFPGQSTLDVAESAAQEASARRLHKLMGVASLGLFQA